MLSVIKLFVGPWIVQASFWPQLLQDGSHRGKLGQALTAGFSAPRLKWKFLAGAPAESSIVVGDHMIFGAAGDRAFAVRKDTGTLEWSFTASSNILASGALAGATKHSSALYLIGSDDHFFYALEQGSGKVAWKFRAHEFTGGATVGEQEGVVYVGAGDSKLHAYFLNGTKRFDFRASDQVCSTPALSDQGIYFGDDGGMFYMLDRSSGVKNWALKFPSGIRSPPRLEDDAIFISIGDPDGSKSGEIIRLSYDGAVQWRSDCGKKKSKCDSCWTSPAVVGDVVVAGCGLDTKKRGVIWGLAKDTGSVRWRVKAGDDCQTSSPVILGDAVILGCTDGTLYAIEAATGTVRWKFRADKGIWATPALDADGTMYVASHDGFVYALSPDGEGQLEL